MRLVVSIQLHRHRFRTLSILIVGVVPDLRYGCFHDRRHMGVRQRRDRTFYLGVRQRITFRQHAFRPGVLDLDASSILRQVFNRRRPAVRFIQRHFSAIGQHDRQARRTLAVLIAGVIPHLRYGCFRRLRRVAVRQRRDRTRLFRLRQRIAFRQRAFRPGVNDFLASSVLRQVLNLRGPIVRLVQRYSSTIGQRDRQARRTLAVLIV